MILLILYYVLKYTDGDEETGNRKSKFLRSKYLFGKSTIMLISNPEVFRINKKMLFVVVGNLTNMGLIHSFGFHGGTFSDINLVYMLPRILFKIPFLRDFLLWSGAVCGGEHTIMNLLESGKCVAYCPSEMQDLIKYTENNSQKIVLTPPSSAIFELAKKNSIMIIPVLISGETDRYWILRGHFIHQIQVWAYEKFRWAFPTLFIKRRRAKELRIAIGQPMDTSIHDDPEAFSKLFMGQFNGLIEVYGENREVILK